MSDEEVVKKIVESKREDFPKEISDYSVTLSTDHAGDPAVYLTFKVRNAKSPSRSKVLEFRRFAEVVEEEILNRKLKHWPYVRFVDARSR